MSTKEVQHPGEDAETQYEAGNLGRGLARLSFVNRLEDVLCQALRSGDPGPDVGGNKVLRAHRRARCQSNCGGVFPSAPQLSCRVLRIWGGSALGVRRGQGEP